MRRGPKRVPPMYDTVASYGTGRMTTGARSYAVSASGNPRKLTGAPHGSWASALSTERDRRHHRRPTPILAALGAGRDVERAHDLAREQPLLAPLVPRGVGIERHTEHRGQHRGCQVFGVFAGDHFVLAVAVMLGDVAVERRAGRHRQAAGRGQQPATLGG